MGLSLRRFDEPEAFYSRIEAFLLEREAEHNLLLGLTAGLMKHEFRQYPPYMACVEQDGAVQAVALRTPPHNLILSEVKKDDAALRLIAQDVHQVYADLPGVSGSKSVTAEFARHWQEISGRAYHVHMQQRIYRLERVRPVTGVSGEMRPATTADYDLLVDWIMGFNADALEPTSREEAAQIVDRFMSSEIRGLRLWCDEGRPVSLAGFSGPTPHGIRVAPVYTPAEFRKRGYASACVAAMSQGLLDEGRKFCFLFTDLGNPTSNHIYQAIGYEPVSDVDEYRFEGVYAHG
jgi:predicted GNAT family acetyltransferase